MYSMVFFSNFRKKKSKDGKTTSPEQVESPPRNNNQERSNDNITYRNKSNGAAQQRPYSMADFSNAGNDRPFIKPDQLQKELVQAKIEEMKRAKNAGGVKKRKSDNEINKIGRSTSPSKDERLAYKSGYNTWNVHDASNMREKSKQFFKNETSNNGLSGQDSARSSMRSVNLQRQSSLPPRTKKENLDIQRIMPRAPSGPMYRSPEQKPRAFSRGSDITNYVHTRSVSSDATSHNYIRNSSSEPRNSKSNKNKNLDTTPLSHNRLKKPDEGEIRYSSISDITRSGGSVKISHKAEI